MGLSEVLGLSMKIITFAFISFGIFSGPKLERISKSRLFGSFRADSLQLVDLGAEFKFESKIDSDQAPNVIKLRRTCYRQSSPGAHSSAQSCEHLLISE